MFYHTQTAENAEKCRFLWPRPSTFDLDLDHQTRLPCEFGVNPFSGSRDTSYTNKKVTDSAKTSQKQNRRQFTAYAVTNHTRCTYIWLHQRQSNLVISWWLQYYNEIMIDFYSSPQCSHCKRCSSYSNSVRLSLRPSVCHTPVLCQNDGTQHGAVCTVR